MEQPNSSSEALLLQSVLGDNSPWITNVSTYLVNRSTECLCSGIIFGDVCIANSLGRQRECLTLKERAGSLTDIAECGQYNEDNVSLEQTDGVLTAHYKRFEFPKLRVPLL